MTPQRRGFFRRIRIGGSLAEFNSLEVGAEILYRALVLRFGNVSLYNVKSRSLCHLAHGATSRTVSTTKINCSNEAAEDLTFN